MFKTCLEDVDFISFVILIRFFVEKLGKHQKIPCPSSLNTSKRKEVVGWLVV